MLSAYSHNMAMKILIIYAMENVKKKLFIHFESRIYIFNYTLSKALCTYSTLIYLEACFTLGLKHVASVKEWKHRENYAQFTKSRN